MTTWFDLPSTLQRRISAAEPCALKLFFERYICRPHGITFTYTADRTKWFALIRRRHISVPPPIDLVALAICGHEAAHCIIPRCSGMGRHRIRKTASHECLECERGAWEFAMRLMPFNQGMHERLRTALRLYRVATPAPAQVQREADQLMGSVAFCAHRNQTWKWQHRLALQAAAMQDVERHRARQRAFDARQQLVNSWKGR